MLFSEITSNGLFVLPINKQVVNRNRLKLRKSLENDLPINAKPSQSAKYYSNDISPKFANVLPTNQTIWCSFLISVRAERRKCMSIYTTVPRYPQRLESDWHPASPCIYSVSVCSHTQRRLHCLLLKEAFPDVYEGNDFWSVNTQSSPQSFCVVLRLLKAS